MEQKIIDALTAAKQRLEEVNGGLRQGALGRVKNDVVISQIKELLPKKEFSFSPSSYNPDLVYPKSH